jgi:hypothetical protein
MKINVSFYILEKKKMLKNVSILLLILYQTMYNVNCVHTTETISIELESTIRITNLEWSDDYKNLSSHLALELQEKYFSIVIINNNNDIIICAHNAF